MIVSILHLSDLHRDPQNEITTDALIHSLELDRDRYTGSESPRIEPPHLVIVSGDLVRGISPDSDNPMGELKDQYQQAEDFLTQLAENFVDGNKNKIVLVPGNHDVSIHHFLNSLDKVDFDRSDPSMKELVQQLFAPASRLRWSWESMDLFEIARSDEYDRRLEPFCEFYESFYEGSRSFGPDPASQYDVFDFPDLGLSTVGLSSCHNNDLLNKAGSIHPDSIAHASRELKDWTYQKRIRIAAWHHDTSGSPDRSDYMDADVLQFLIDSGFSMGFHGHHHKPKFIDEHFVVGGESKITLLSAGTLCAGPTQLPTGHPRAYNVVEIDTEALRGKLHLRQMHNDDFTAPVWGPGQLPTRLSSFFEFDIQPPPEPPSQSAVAVRELRDAEQLYQRHEYSAAIEKLLPMAADNSLARRLISECYVAVEDPNALIELLDPPRSTTEIIYLADALWAERKKDRLRELINSSSVVESTDPTLAELRTRFAERLG